ncbi:MAG: transglycosylase domain-containing protein, partial [Phototrophicaceae bacterium]
KSGAFPADDSIEAPIDPGAESAPAYAQDAAGEQVIKAEEEQRRSTVGWLITAAVIIFGAIFIFGAAVILTGTLWYSQIAERWRPSIVALADYEPSFNTALILDVEGKEIARLQSSTGGDRTQIKLQEISPYLIHAVVSTENERYFADPGWDLQAIIRAFLQNLTSGEVVSGGSTITQQITRNLIFANSNVFTELSLSPADRKLNEVIAAAEISQQYSKEEILELYMNEIYLGNLAYGVQAASEFYFDKSAADLNIAESAFIAGLIQAPATYDPITNREATLDRMEDVLRLMGEVGCLPIPYQASTVCITQQMLDTQIAIESAQVETREYLPRESIVEYPHFVTFVQAQLERDFGSDEIYRRGFVVRTTLDRRLQETAQTTLTQRIAQSAGTGVNTGTVMITDAKSGAIRAMVGSPDFNDETIDGQVNLALTWQQPGSAIKPVTYAAAFEQRMTDAGPTYLTPSSILWDVPTNYPDGTAILNFNRTYAGPLSARVALQSSLNVPAVKVYQYVGNEYFKEIAQRMGLTFLPEAQFNLTTGVGSTEVRLYDMMQAYGTLANNGQFTPLFAIESITDKDGRTVEIPSRTVPDQAISPQVAFLMQNILSDDASRSIGFGASPTLLTLPQYANAVAAKTGTSNEGRDLWAMGFTNNIVIGSWMGRPDNRETFNTSGYITVAPLFNSLMQTALTGTQPIAFTNPPQGVVLRQVCGDTGTLPSDGCTSLRNEYFVDTQPPAPATAGFVAAAEINTWTNLLANEFCPGDRVMYTFANISDPAAVSWLNSYQEGRNVAARLGLPIPLPQPPSGSCNQNTPLLQAGITNPSEGAVLTTASLSVSGSIGASNFASYDLQIASAANPENFQIVDGPYRTLPVNNQVGVWNTENFANGEYILRLGINSTEGGYAYRTVKVTLNKPLPTPTPTPPPIPTAPSLAPILGQPTAIPFDSQSIGLPTPTATISLGG